MIHHFITKKKDQKTHWALPYFCFGCLLQSAIVRSFTQLHLSRNSGFRGSLERIKLHFIARYTRWLIKKAKKCEQLSRVFVGMGNFTFREMPLGEMLMESRSVSFFSRLLLWKFVEISKYVFCTAKTFISLWFDCLLSLSLILGDLKSHATYCLTYRLLSVTTLASTDEKFCPLALKEISIAT